MHLDRILIGIDFSPASFATARWVARHFAPGAELVLAHVIAIPEPPPILRSRYPRRDLLVETVHEGANKRLRELATSLGSDRVQIAVREGESATAISEIARERSSDVVVVGAHGERAGVLEGLGSTAEHLLRTATTPVLIATAPRDHPPTRILVPVDESETSARALRVARYLGERFGHDVTALHVVRSGVMSHVLAAAATLSATPQVSPDPFRTSAQTTARNWLDLVLETTADAGGNVSAEVVFGEPAQEITAFAGQRRSDLIVIGRRGAGGLRRAVLGSVVDAVLRHAPCSVLVVPESETA